MKCGQAGLLLLAALVALARGVVPHAARASGRRVHLACAHFPAPAAARPALSRAAIGWSSAGESQLGGPPRRRRLRLELPRVDFTPLAIGMLVGLAWPDIARVVAGLALLCWLSSAAFACFCWMLRRRAIAAPLVAAFPQLGGWLRAEPTVRTSPYDRSPPSGDGSSLRSVFLVNVNVNGEQQGAQPQQRQADTRAWADEAMDVTEADFEAGTSVEAAALRESAGAPSPAAFFSAPAAPAAPPFSSAASAPASSLASADEPPVKSLAVAYDRALRLTSAPGAAGAGGLKGSAAPSPSQPPVGAPPVRDAAMAEEAQAAPQPRAGAAVQRAAQNAAAARAATVPARAAAAPAEARAVADAQVAQGFSQQGPTAGETAGSAQAGAPPAPATRPAPSQPQRPPAVPAAAFQPAAAPPAADAQAAAPLPSRFASRAEQLAYEQMLSRSIAWAPVRTGSALPAPSVGSANSPPQGNQSAPS